MKEILKELLNLANFSPVLTNLVLKNEFGKACFLSAKIPSSELGVVNTEKGLVFPKWIEETIKNKYDLVVIEDIDSIDIESQEKFYELLKYKTLSSVSLPKNLKIVLTFSDIKNVSGTITSLCQIIR